MRRRRLQRILLVLLSSWLLAAYALDRIGDHAKPRGRYDAIVVAGAGVLRSGEPGRPLRARVERAVELYREGRAPRIVMTGGLGDFPPAESIVASALAQSMGVPAAAIVCEERSTSTEENAREARYLIGRGARVLLVTDRFHVYRARRVFAREFAHVDAVGTVCAPWPRFRGAMREVVALASYTVLGRI